MSADKFSLFYCLTEAGWLLIEETSRPAGWVRIYELKVYQGSQFGQESRTWHLLKTNADWSLETADQLEMKFPRPERSRELSPESLKVLGITPR
jgi:hypothetical protein